MDLGVHVLLAHEMLGLGGQAARFGCEFSAFFSCVDGATPGELLRRGIYSEIAVVLKGGAWRKASMALLGIALGLSKEESKTITSADDLEVLLGAVDRVGISMLPSMRSRRASRLQHSAGTASSVEAITIEMQSASVSSSTHVLDVDVQATDDLKRG